MVMIIKGLFRRYERWNPVHPTYGAFWGMGLGIGCGVGWGPGFGPEVIGYVGSGCGVGFSVGITLAGVGIGLPATFITDSSYKALLASRSYTRDLMRSMRNNTEDDFKINIPSQFWSLQQKANERFSYYLKNLDIFKKGIETSDFKDVIPSHGESISDSFRDLKKSSESDGALLASRSYIRDVTPSTSNDAEDEFKINIPSQFWSLQQKANESYSHYLKNLDIFKKGMETFNLKDAISSHKKSISKSFRDLKKSSESVRDNKE